MTDDTLEREALGLFEDLLDLPEAEWEAWLAARTAGRPELAERLAALTAAHRNAELRTGGAVDALDEPPAPERIGAYAITGCIGRGGMGSVYRGERQAGDFAHVVAIKVIKPGLLSETLVERFRRERELLASLSHPAIAQLYDGGETEDGSPYFIMEYVDGLPLTEWAEENRPSLAERQRMFCEICAAVAFAHRNLIVHRDLTPSNVLVTANGPKLIDFGIARAPDAPGAGGTSRPSIAGLSLTPGFAAPERMVSGEVTTAADIFSLGKLLERLIRPGPRDRELIAIVARATQPDPLARYPTAQALGEEVAAWRGGHPVAAMEGGWAYVTRKFVTRHRLGVAAACAALALLIGAFGLTLAANGRAEAALAKSEQRFAQTRSIAKAMLFEAFDEVSRTPGSTKARELLARQGLTYLEALAADGQAPLDVQLEAGLGFLRLAKVMGSGQTSSLGRYQDANALLARSEQILQRLHKAHPEDARVRQGLADLLLEQSGVNLYNNSQPKLARKQALEVQDLLRAEAASKPDSARLYATAIQAEGDSWGWEDDYAKARDVHLRAERFLAGLSPALQANQGVMSARSANIRLLGEAYNEIGEDGPARAAMEQAVALNRALVKAAPDNPMVIRKLAISLYRIAIVHRTKHRDQLARAAIEEALVNVGQLQARDPNDAGALSLFAVTAEVKTELLGDQKRFEEAYAMGEEVIAAQRRLVTLADGAAGARRSLSQALRTQAGLYYNGRSLGRACATWRETLALLTELDSKGELTETDRKNALPEMKDYLRRACDGGPPRAALGPTV